MTYVSPEYRLPCVWYVCHQVRIATRLSHVTQRSYPDHFQTCVVHAHEHFVC